MIIKLFSSLWSECIGFCGWLMHREILCLLVCGLNSGLLDVCVLSVRCCDCGSENELIASLCIMCQMIIIVIIIYLIVMRIYAFFSYFIWYYDEFTISAIIY